MKKTIVTLMLATVALAGCNRSTNRSGSSTKPSDAIQQKLQEIAGANATDCGRLTSQAPDQLKKASDCAMQAAQSKRAFYVAYDLPGMTVAVAGNHEGKFFFVSSSQAEGTQPTAADIKSGLCEADVRVAQSGRVTCLSPGSMGGMGSNPHSGMSMPPGMENPHGGMTMPPAGTPNPHGNGASSSGMSSSHESTGPKQKQP